MPWKNGASARAKPKCNAAVVCYYFCFETTGTSCQTELCWEDTTFQRQTLPQKISSSALQSHLLPPIRNHLDKNLLWSLGFVKTFERPFGSKVFQDVFGHFDLRKEVEEELTPALENPTTWQWCLMVYDRLHVPSETYTFRIHGCRYFSVQGVLMWLLGAWWQ